MVVVVNILVQLSCFERPRKKRFVACRLFVRLRVWNDFEDRLQVTAMWTERVIHQASSVYRFVFLFHPAAAKLLELLHLFLLHPAHGQTEFGDSGHGPSEVHLC